MLNFEHVNKLEKRLPTMIRRHIPRSFISVGLKIIKDKDFKNFDFVRNSYTAEFTTKRGQYWSIIQIRPEEKLSRTSCTCPTYMQQMNCPHLTALYLLIYSKASEASHFGDTLHKFYEQSLWSSLAKICYEHYDKERISIQSELTKNKSEPELKISGVLNNDQKIFEFKVPDLYLNRIVEKYRWDFFDDPENESSVWDKFIENVQFIEAEKTDVERRMNETGYKSWLQKFENTYWFDFSKLWFLGYDQNDYSVDYLNETKSLRLFSPDQLFSFHILQNQVSNMLIKLSKIENVRESLKIFDQNAVLNHSIAVTDQHELEITPVLELPDQGKPIFLDGSTKMKPEIFGKYIFIKDFGFYQYRRAVEYYDGNLFKFEETRIPNDRIIHFIREYKRYIDEEIFYHVSQSLKNQKFVNKVKKVDVFVDEIEDDWIYLSLKYRIGEDTISFYDIYQALKQNRRYLISKNHWIDLHQIDFRWIRSMLKEEKTEFDLPDKQGTSFRVRKVNFIKMNAHLPIKSKIKTRRHLQDLVQKIINFEPLSALPSLEKCNYTLRDYQKNGFQWLWFLYENKLSGLLCDDMGLGKTYESLSLIDAISLSKNRQMNFLVVCPTSVLSHWFDKLTQLKKKVHVHLYHGSERTLKSLKKQKYSVILTSYGVLRNDLAEFAKLEFEVAVFDEIQTAKNKASLTNAALNQLNSRMRLGLTGTPIENTLNELKALFDIVLPDYLGGDFSFRKNYIYPIERHNDQNKTEELHKVVSPFMLRRTKNQVLTELPPKIEEVRKCELSEDQIELYESVINDRAQSLLAQLYKETQDIPYIHIFAVLSLLKQICNHPAQLKDSELNYQKYKSGKWELFCELLDESLNSGFKVVVFSQYLRMLALIEAYLKDKKVEFATIKGATQNRRKMIERFNHDPDCLVFTGSLGAAGKGIDLIGGSVVIHYDRWWNAARENQATDRVHRIGQIRGVQVFKLVTEGTLEEKIDRLISSKQKLMDELVREDDANIVKKLDREELIELLQFEK